MNQGSLVSYKKTMNSNRKTLYYIGLVLQVIGFVLFISVFFTAFSHNGFGPTTGSFMNAPIGMVLIIVGSIISNIGKRGMAGSGIILDPEQAREDLKPFSKQAGGMISDALEEVKGSSTKEVVKIRCRECQHLNEENAKYCSHCGVEL